MSRKKHALMIVSVTALLVAAIWLTLGGRIYGLLFKPTESNIEQGVGTNGEPDEDPHPRIEVIAENLNIPWEVAFLPEGDILVSERSGTLKLLGQNDRIHSISGVEHLGEGGLLGLALHPEFTENNWLYLYFTTREGSALSNKIVRYTLRSDSLDGRTDILASIPAASNHDGGRIAFGPDGYLYVGTGDAGDGNLAQDTGSLAGKILRIRDNGNPAPNNPFDNEVYSYGHRNVQGLAWDGDGRLWATEHGPSGFESGHDELNLIERGANYGWPLVRGDQTREGMRTPVRHSGANDTWAPAGLAYHGGSLFFAGLRGQTLYEAKLDGDTANLKAHFRGEYGRLRAVVMHDGDLYVTTSNTDGRGNPRSGDDKLIRFSTSLFE